MQRATGKNKSIALDFIEDAKLSGKGDAVGALKRAMQVTDYKQRPPSLIYFLTDGFDLQTQNMRSFVQVLENFRKTLAPSTRINTIAFWAQPSDCKILQKVAESSGGEFLSIE